VTSNIYFADPRRRNISQIKKKNKKTEDVITVLALLNTPLPLCIQNGWSNLNYNCFNMRIWATLILELHAHCYTIRFAAIFDCGYFHLIESFYNKFLQNGVTGWPGASPRRRNLANAKLNYPPRNAPHATPIVYTQRIVNYLFFLSTCTTCIHRPKRFKCFRVKFEIKIKYIHNAEGNAKVEWINQRVQSDHHRAR